MNFRLLPALIVLLLAFSFSAACTGSGGDAGPSTPGARTPAATATPVPTTEASLVPGPTQTMPPGKEVAFEIKKEYPQSFTHDLTIEFRGGKGQDYILKENGINLRVTKSTGEVVTKTMQPRIGDAVTINEAEGENRVEITVSLVSGGPYKVVDEIAKVR
ncbi:MAG: hypothetical protein KA818_10845 [Methanoculleus sp.]|nr:hypothetical protein [Methanoculleus sp.]